MNCPACRSRLVGYLEKLVDGPTAERIAVHLSGCTACSAELDRLEGLVGALTRDARPPADVSVETATIDRIVRRQARELRRLTSRRPRLTAICTTAAVAAIVFVVALAALWLLLPGRPAGAGGVLIPMGGALAAMVALGAVLWLSPSGDRSRAAEVLAKGVGAAGDLESIHIRARMRTAEGESFSYVQADHDFVPLELWKRFGGPGQWRVEKPGRVAVMDGRWAVMLVNDRWATKGSREAVFDSHWLPDLANISGRIRDELCAALANGWDLALTHEKADDGTRQIVVSVSVTAGVDEHDYLYNTFLTRSDQRRVYRFDAATQRLEKVEIYLQDGRREVLVFEVLDIDYDPAIAPSIFTLDVPDDVVWHESPQVLPDNERYEHMTPAQVARAFFEACAEEDWDEARKFWSSDFGNDTKQWLGDLEVVRIGKPFQSKAYPGWYVPYEVRLRNGDVRKHNLALRKDNPARRHVIDGGL